MTRKNINNKGGILQEESFTESEVKKIFNSVDRQAGFDIEIMISLYKSHRAFFQEICAAKESDKQ